MAIVNFHDPDALGPCLSAPTASQALAGRGQVVLIGRRAPDLLAAEIIHGPQARVVFHREPPLTGLGGPNTAIGRFERDIVGWLRESPVGFQPPDRTAVYVAPEAFYPGADLGQAAHDMAVFVGRVTVNAPRPSSTPTTSQEN